MTDTPRTIWAAAFEAASAKIRPWVAHAIDAKGEEYAYVTENAPGPLAKHYHELYAKGYAEGWLDNEKEDAK